MSTTTACPDCGEEIPKRARSCPCGWRPTVQSGDYQAKLESRRRDPTQTQVLICRGDHPPGEHSLAEIVWFPGEDQDRVRACEWQTQGRRCRMLGTDEGYCGFHRACLNNGTDHPTLQDLAEWLDATERWRGDLQFIWGRVTGEIWLFPERMRTAEFAEPVGAPKTKREAQDLASAIASGRKLTRPGLVEKLRNMAERYPANAAWYNREADRMEREYEPDKEKAIEAAGEEAAAAGVD